MNKKLTSHHDLFQIKQDGQGSTISLSKYSRDDSMLNLKLNGSSYKVQPKKRESAVVSTFKLKKYKSDGA
jgi:hypothetical protein